MLHENLNQVDEILELHFPLANPVEELSVKVGPIILNALMPQDFIEHLITRYSGFLSPGRPDFHIVALRSKDLDLKEYPNITVKSKRGGTVHYIFRWDFVARVDTDSRKAIILIAPVGTPLCVDSILRISCAFALPEKGGLLVHSAAIASDFGALLFCGVSGSGKSTISKLSMEIRDVLTDEMSLVEKKDSGEYRVWGTPFWGEMQMSVNRSSPLKGIILLRKSLSNGLSDMAAGEAILEFMRTVLYFGQNLETLSKLLDVSTALLEKVPLKKLDFLPEKSLWEVLDDCFGNEGHQEQRDCV